LNEQKVVCLDDFIASNLIPQNYPDLFSENEWKWMVRQRKNNGLDVAFRKVGKKLYVNKRSLAGCIDAQLD